MKIAALAMVVSMLGVGVVAAEPAAKKAEPAAKAEKAAATCKMKFVGKGLERKAVCVIEEPIVVKTSAKPAVVVVAQDPRRLVGRPKSGDRLDGLSHQLRP